MTGEEWGNFKYRVWARQKREKMILRDLRDIAEITVGCGLMFLLCGFCWLL